MSFIISGENIKNIKLGDQDIKKVMMNDKQIWPDNNSLIGIEKIYDGFCNNTTSTGASATLIPINIEEQNKDGQPIIHCIVTDSSGSWTMDYGYFEGSSRNNPLNNIIVSSTGKRNNYFKLWWDNDLSMWIWNSGTPFISNRFRYICRTEEEARNKPQFS